MTTPTTFHPFPRLPLELRRRIWAFSLPPPRILHVRPTGGPSDGYNRFNKWTYYTTKPSYGGSHPSALSVNRESRTEALRYLTFRFGAYWDMERDTLFIERRAPAGVGDGMEQLCNLRSRGMLGGFKRLALEWGIWEVTLPEYCWDSLANLPNIRTCLFIYRSPQVANPDLRDIDVVDPGVVWKIMPVPEEIQNKGLDAIRKIGGRVAVSGTTASWTSKSVERGSLEIDIARMRDRKTRVENISKEQQEREWRMLDWFG